MNRRSFIKAMGLAAAGCGLRHWTQCTAAASDQGRSQPNILFILVDDVAWNGLGCTGSSFYETPNLDRLAADGMRFTRAYAPAPICSASRAAILTGQSPARLGFEFVTKSPGEKEQILRDLPAEGVKLQAPPFTLNLPLEKTTIAEVLRTAGYTTGFFGKWHVSAHYKRYLGWSPTHGPAQQGFDAAEEDFGGHTYNRKAQKPAESYRQGQYPADTLTDRAIRFLEDHKEAGPFYLQVNHFYVHTPVRSQAAWLTEKYRKKLDAGVPARFAAYGAFTQILDHQIGRLLDAVDRFGLRENTFVVFFSDNGGDPTYNRHAPLRGAKWTLYEGGIRVPMIARRPGVIAKGVLCDTAVNGTDLMPTFADVAGARLDPRIPLDGDSLVPLFEGRRPESLQDRRFIFHFPYYHPERGCDDLPRVAGTNDPRTPFLEPHSAMIDGDTKVIQWYESDRVELFDLARDPGEQNDLARSQPERARKMAAELHRALERMHARFPRPIAAR